MSIEKLPSGKYRAVVRHEGRKACSEAVETRAGAAVLEAKLKMQMGGETTTGKHTVGEVVAGYIADSESRLSPGTLNFYRVGERLLPPAFSNRDVATLRPVQLDALYNELRAGGASEHKVNRVHRLLSAAFGRAMRYDWMISNPCASATKPKVYTKEITPPSPEEVRRIISAAQSVNPDLSTCLRVAAATGMRRSELCALRWSDIGEGTITVRRSIVEGDDGVLHTRDTKTGSRGWRTVSVDAETVAAVNDLRIRQAAEAKAQLLPKPTWCFSLDGGVSPMRPMYLTMSFARLSTETTLHGLRHYSATRLLAAGIAAPTVSKRLGHSSPAVTLSVYAHHVPQADVEAAAIMGDLLS